MSLNKYNWFSQNPEKSNQYCPYCGREFSTFGTRNDIKKNTDKEHLIGRNFVPKESFKAHSETNFIFRVCKTCNSRKSNYERQISSVSLLNTCGARSQNEQEKIITKAQHDNSGFIKGKKVIDSNVTLNAESKIWGTTIITQFSGPPQVQETTIANLAFMHMQGLIGFAILSPNNRNNSIYLSKKCFHFYQSFSKDNWGSPSLEFLRTLTLPWEPLLIKTTAKNNFKVYIKSNNEIIFWLLEWNMYYRVCGFIGNSIECSKIIDSIPEEPYRYVGKDKDGISLFLRRSIPLSHNSVDFIFT